MRATIRLGLTPRRTERYSHDNQPPQGNEDMTDITRRKLFIGVGSYALLSQLALSQYVAATSHIQPVDVDKLLSEVQVFAISGDKNVIMIPVHRFILKDKSRYPTMFSHMPNQFGLYQTTWESTTQYYKTKLIDMIHHLAEYYDEVV